MEENKKGKLDELKTEIAPQGSAIPQTPATKKPVFSLERLRLDCLKVFGVTVSTFDGAMFERQGKFTIDEAREIIQNWQNTPIPLANIKEVE